ncbi:MAG: polymerase sigma-70 factor, subfamily [Thermoleophilaceae bacterium]|jgi:RNA polymerase sigma-70 factor (ECF subfamily)|nr:polymerase sigma-70 factor, subfamily [Thermoleophilaceae bacterium]
MASTDATLVEKLPFDRSGDELRELYRRYASELFGFATSALGDRELAEEVVQDVFAQLWRHAGDYDHRRASVRTWLYAIARNRIIDAHRRAAARPQRADDDSFDTAAELDASLEHALVRWQVTAALARLSPSHREVIRLAHYGGLTMREIADRTGVPLGTVKSRTSYALRHLRLIFDEMELES